jgi:hypothetical protein
MTCAGPPDTHDEGLVSRGLTPPIAPCAAGRPATTFRLPWARAQNTSGASSVTATTMRITKMMLSQTPALAISGTVSRPDP